MELHVIPCNSGIVAGTGVGGTSRLNHSIIRDERKVMARLSAPVEIIAPADRIGIG